MKLSLILENTDIQKALTKLDPKRIQFMCGDRMSSMDSRSSGTEPDIGRTAELVKMLSDCDPTPAKKWVVGTEFIKKPWVSSQFNNGNISVDGFPKMSGDQPQIKLPEDTASMVELIKFFSDPGKKAQLKKYFPSVPTDLQMHDIKSALTASQNLMDKLRSMKATAFNPVVANGAVKVFDANSYEVLMYPRLDLAKNFGLDPQTVVASLQETGMGTKWCTRTDYEPGSRAEPYLSKDTIYTLFKDKVATYQTVVHGREEQFMDRAGTEVGQKVDSSINQMFLAGMMAARKMIMDKYTYNPPSRVQEGVEESDSYIKNYQEMQGENIAGIIKFGGAEAITQNPELRKQIVDSLQVARNPKFISIAITPLIDFARAEIKAKFLSAGVDFNTASLEQTLQALGLSELYQANDGAANGYGPEGDNDLVISDSTKEIVSLFVRKPTIYGSVIYHAAGHIIIGKVATKELFLGLRRPLSSRKTFPTPMVQFISSGANAEDILSDPRVQNCICSQVSPLVTLIRFNRFTTKMTNLVPNAVWHELLVSKEENGHKRGELKYADVIKKLQDLNVTIPTQSANEAVSV